MIIKLRNSLTAVLLLLMPFITYSQAPTLGTAANFALFTSAGAFSNTGATVVTGDIGTNAGAFTGFPPGIVIGQIQVANPASAQAALDVDVAYADLFGRTCGAVIGTTLGNNQVLAPNVYCLGAASTLNGNLVLDAQGNSGAIFIFKIDGAFSTSSLASVTLINGASACNVYWQINGQVDLSTGTAFVGTILANGAIHLLEGATLTGRGLSRAGAIELHNNVVTKGTPPVASTISASGPVALCAGGSVVLSGNIGGTFSTGATTSSITVTAAGDYFVTNSNACGTVTSNHIIVTVGQQQACTITGGSSLCPGQSTQLCVPAGASSYLWSNGATSNCITVTNAGTYSVTVTNANGCTQTCSKTVTMGAGTIQCTITGNTTVCPGQTTQLCAPAGNGYTYLWSTGATTRCVTLICNGTFPVSVTVSNGTCSSTCTVIVTVGPDPVPVCSITGNNTFCQGQSTQLCAPVGNGYTYLWNTGATSRCIIASAAGVYTVTVTNANGCSSTCSKTVSVNQTTPPACSITGNGLVCPGQTTELCAPYGYNYTYAWSNGATTRCIMAGAGTHTVTITNSTGCSSTCTKIVAATTSALSCNISGSTTICPGGFAALCASTGVGYTYLWNTGATTSCINATAAGTYTVVITNANGCSSTCSKTVTVSNTALKCSITGSNTICPGGFTTLCATGGTGYTYVWNTGATTRCIDATAAGTYSVTITNSTGCSSTCSITVTAAPLNCSITGSSTICPGGSVSLCAPGGTGYTYLWSNGATTRCISVSAPGAYTVTIGNGAGCSATCTKTVTAAATPSSAITGGSTICHGTTVSLCAPSATGNTYLWSNGATTRCITVSTTGTFSVTVTRNGCSSTSSRVITYSPGCPPCNVCVPARITAGSQIAVTDNIINVNAYPNPFNSKAMITFESAASDTHVLVELYNPGGNKMATLFNSSVRKGGLYQVEVNAANLTSGIYYYRIINGNQVINRKLVLIK